MGQSELPDNLGEIECWLKAMDRPEPSAALRTRVMADVRGQLRRDHRQRTWSYAATLAASVLIWLNLSLSAATVTDYRLRAHDQTEVVVCLGAGIRALLPEMSEREAARQALLLRCGARLAWSPQHDTGAWSVRTPDTVNELLP